MLLCNQVVTISSELLENQPASETLTKELARQATEFAELTSLLSTPEKGNVKLWQQYLEYRLLYLVFTEYVLTIYKYAEESTRIMLA